MNCNGLPSIESESIVPLIITGCLIFYASYWTCSYVCNIDRYLYRGTQMCIFGSILIHIYVQVHSSEHYPSFIEHVFLYLEQREGTVLRLALGDGCFFFLFHWLLHWLFTVYRTLRLMTRKDVWNVLGRVGLQCIHCIPCLARKVQHEMDHITQILQHTLKQECRAEERMLILPKHGQTDLEILTTLTRLSTRENLKWETGKVSGAVYHGESQHLALLNQAYSLYSVSNPLHADIWPSIVKFEAEIISMTANLLSGGDSNVCGVISSGGTESILLATKTHREFYRKEFGITQPEIICCVTAHAAIDKACDLLSIQLIKVPCDPDSFQINVESVRRHITRNTIMLYASAPNFPQGIIDDIPAMSVLATRYQVGLHVDACLGAFVLPFAKMAGFDLPSFDFENPGVTSMSCDTHKYGYAAKGTSVVLYRDMKLRRYQYFCFPEWTGGLYVTPTIAGSRPGGLSAACWASFLRLGEAGFVSRVRDIMITTQEIISGIHASLPGLKVLGTPLAMIVAFTTSSPELSILKVGTFMTERGWSLNSLQFPTCIHLCVTVQHIGKSSLFLNDLELALNHCRLGKTSKEEEVSGSAIYGMASTLPAGPVDDILRTYTDVTLEA